MACSLYNNKGCGCGGCTHFVRTTDVTIDGVSLVLNIPDAVYSNKEKVCICVSQNLPDGTLATDNVVVTVGADATQYPLITKCGNAVHADQIRSRKVYHTNVSTDIASFVVSERELCGTAYNFPTIPTPTTPVSRG